MKKSTFPLEIELGMRYYASDIPGIGGRLRTVPEDFRVDEIPLEGKGGSVGPYLICTLEKTNWELQHAVKEIAKCLGISHRRIGWAGTKDRNAVTRQRISIYNVTHEQVAGIHLKDIVLTPVGQSNEALRLGDLAGNRFAIAIRDTESADLAGHAGATARTIAEGVPNYFGLQRFGAIRPVTHTVGEWILRGDYEQAVMTYIGMEFPNEPENIKTIRSAFRSGSDAGEALRSLPVQMNYERAMLHYLYSHPGDYAGALHELPPKLLSMFVSAFQSYIFNCALSGRLDDGHTLTDPVAGDRLLFANGRTDVVTAAGIPAAGIHIRRGRCSIALFMPGRDQTGSPVTDPVTEALLADRKITPADFARASSFVQTKFDGAFRPVALRADVNARTEEKTLFLDFTLPPGHYATTVCREYMKADPVKMI